MFAGSSPNATDSQQPQSSQAQLAFSSSYPNPPMQYINLFTDENIAKGKAPEPPRPVTEGNYTMFGVSMTNDEAIIRPLESQGIKRLYPRDYDHKRELKKMNASILVNFLDLLDVLVKCPDTGKREEKCADIALLFVQMHHLINELRPHQGRETIRVTLQCQKRQRQEIVGKLNKQIERVHELVSQTVAAIPQTVATQPFTDRLLQLTAEMKQESRKASIKANHNGSDEYQVNHLDSLMCNIVDEI